ncbi:hypothetical protein K788_0000403 [Paraburkholderia caribensis MBA4]|uniref:Uncharacterized protein n=1 Tax=Paraburkholderia caribensis MBA4 TaxID=1323664 RepID=A0A0P0RIT5_9BURK|nr:hypothetical protein [Paraburkholderia caribensis]ALL68566.1 hypothetical protein K788_0000403 [Paraburkholderia caribensis MBA4]
MNKLAESNLADPLRSTNPEQRLSPDVTKELARAESTAAQIRALTDGDNPTPDTRAKLLDIRRGLIGTDKVLAGRFKDVTLENARLIADDLKLRNDTWKNIVTRTIPPLIFPAPKQTDSTFWWASTTAHAAPDMTSDFRDDGLYFFGGPKVNNYDGELHTSFGATSQFSLQPERIPDSASGWYSSAPHVELFGGVVAFAPDWDLIQGNGIAQCNLTLRQTIYQNTFGQTGPVRVVVAEAIIQDQWQIYLKNTGSSRHLDAPGSRPLPGVTFNVSNFHPWEVLWAETEIRYEIYLNTEGALVWCEPDMIIRNFQWPLAVA